MLGLLSQTFLRCFFLIIFEFLTLYFSIISFLSECQTNLCISRIHDPQRTLHFSIILFLGERQMLLGISKIHDQPRTFYFSTLSLLVEWKMFLGISRIFDQPRKGRSWCLQSFGSMEMSSCYCVVTSVEICLSISSFICRSAHMDYDDGDFQSQNFRLVC